VSFAEKIILGLLLGAYCLAGIYYSNSQGYWHDEIHTLTFMQGVSAYEFENSTLNQYQGAIKVSDMKKSLNTDNFVKNFQIEIYHEGHPPLYFVILKPWSMIFGNSALSLRSFSLMCGILCMLLLFILARSKIQNSRAAWGMLLIALSSPFLFYFFNEARMYALAFLFATLVFKFYIQLSSSDKPKTNFIGFAICATLLLYTHYYGLFFLLSLAIIDIIKHRSLKPIVKYLIPGVLFLPWLLVISHQLGYHDSHWTAGSYSLLKSGTEFIKGIFNLLTSPVSEAGIYQSVAAISLITLLLIFAKIKIRSALYIVIGILVYFLQVFIFDQITDHHSIAVPRYYMLVLIPFLWIVKVFIERAQKYIGIAFCIIFVAISSFSCFQIFTKQSAEKQMYQELCYFIDTHFQPESTLIVVEPRGAMAWGMAYYLQNDFSILTAKNYSNVNQSKKVIFIDEMLGVPNNEAKLHDEQQSKMTLVPFNAVFLYH
jgi:uncharacterized membrane protein